MEVFITKLFHFAPQKTAREKAVRPPAANGAF